MEATDNKEMDKKVTEMPKLSKFLGKHKSPSPLPTALPNKVLVVSSEMLNHTVTDKTTFENDIQEPLAATYHQNVKLIPLNVEISG